MFLVLILSTYIRDSGSFLVGLNGCLLVFMEKKKGVSFFCSAVFNVVSIEICI